jgi:hypothetical protein
MPAGNFHSFFGILRGDSPFPLGLDPEKLEDMEIHVHDKMSRCDDDTSDKLDKIA